MKMVYVETSVVSYLTALPARDLLVAAWQSATLQWWRNRRSGFELCTSQLALDEASAGHPEAAERRMRSLAGLPILPITDAVSDLADAFAERRRAPRKGGRRCIASGHRRVSWGGLPAHLELPPPRQCRDETVDAEHLRRSRICLPRNMHSTGIDGR